MDSGVLRNHRAVENVNESLHNVMEERSKVVLCGTAHQTDGVNSFCLHRRHTMCDHACLSVYHLRSRTEAYQPLYHRSQQVLEDLLRDHLTVAELTQSRSNHSLHTSAGLFLNELHAALENLGSHLLLEHSSEGSGEEGHSLNSDKDHTRMSYGL